MAKAGAPKKAKPKLSDKEQSARSIETARQLEADESGAAFNKVLEKLAPPNAGKSKTDN